MKEIIKFLRKIGILKIGSGDYVTGEYDDLSDIGKVKKVTIKSDKMVYSHTNIEKKFSKKPYKELSKWFWLVIIPIGGSVLLMALGTSTFSFFVVLIVWVLLILVLMRFKLTVIKGITLILIVGFISFIYLVVVSDDINPEIYIEAETGILTKAGEYSIISDSNRGGEKGKEAYLGDGGANLKFELEIEEGGKYELLLRLNDDAAHKSGTRNTTISINNKKIKYIHKSENTNGWKWYSVGDVDLKQGKNIISFTKDKSTPAAFIIDAFKLNKRQIKQ